jgi:arabinan endo-1,5-alpha-L-arabinosidase
MIAKRHAVLGFLALSLLIQVYCGGGGGSGTTPPPVTPPPTYPELPSADNLTGNIQPVHDPSIIMQGATYYSFTTDPGGLATGNLAIRCSQDKLAWVMCGTPGHSDHVFDQIPSWVQAAVPGVSGLWAPDISFFNGLYHVYYAGSTFGSNVSVIGLATNTTLDPTDPSYQWVDQGQVLGSISTDKYNAIDPNILVDSSGNVWLTYGSFWNGISQQQIDPTTGKLIAGQAATNLASRPTVQYDPIEGASLLQHGSYYYLFVSFDFCCQSNPADSNYKIAIGRSSSPNGPFTDMSGTAMLQGGGTILMTGNGTTWNAPGGQTAYLDPASGSDIIVFHALNLQQNGLDYLWAAPVTWSNDWPVIQPSASFPAATFVATTITLSSSAAVIGVGTSVTLTATIKGSASPPTGSVSFSDGATVLGSANLNNAGSAMLIAGSLAVGVHSITAAYGGDATNAPSSSSAIIVTVQQQPPAATSVVLTPSANTLLQGLPLELVAVTARTSGTGTPTGSATFFDGTTSVGTAQLDASGRAIFTITNLAPGPHNLTASFSGDLADASSVSAPVAVTIQKPASAAYSNPLSLNDPATGPVISCPDPAILKVQISGKDTWYLYCTGDAHNSKDLNAQGQLNAHLISIYESTDLVNWTYDNDAFASPPTWVATPYLWAPAIKYFNNQYYLYFTTNVTNLAGSGAAIGVGIGQSPKGPFTDSGTPVVSPETATNCCANAYRWLYDPDVVQDSTGQNYILFGSYVGGISVRKLSADGLTSDPTSEQLIAADNRYEGGNWVQHGGYYYLLASATNCCAGPLTGYGVFAARATSPLGPYIDEQGNAFTAVTTGGTPVLAMNGNRFVGPGGNVVFTDETGQSYILYHAVNLSSPYFPGFVGSTARPVLLDALDWDSNGWPLARGGFGPSDSTAPQPAPASQPGAASGYTATFNSNDQPLVPIAALSDEFNAATLSSQWSFIHATPAYQLTGSAYQVPTVGFDTTNAMAQVPLLAEAAPATDYVLETKVTLNLPSTGAGNDFAQAGLLLYADDADYIRMDLFSDSDTRQIEFIKAESPPASGYPTWGSTDLGAPAIVSGGVAAWMRIVKRTVNAVETYTAYSSADGANWVRGGTWTHSLGAQAKICLYAGNRSGFTASFDYVHVSTLK